MADKPSVERVMVAALILGGACVGFACSSSDSTPTPTSSSSSSSSSSGAASSSSSTSSGSSGDAYGKPCTNPINNPATSSAVDGGGVDPACTGTYSLCASVGGTNKCTRSCTYPGTSGGPKAAPECTNPPTNGLCTPRGFCQ